MFNKVKELFTGKKEVESKLAEVVETPESVAVVNEVPKQVHECDDNCKHEHADHTEHLEHSEEHEKAQPPEEQIAPLTYREIKYLKRARYEEKVSKNPLFKNMYVIRNTKTNQMVEVRAASSFHACNIIGWKPNRVRVVSVTEVKEPKAEEAIAIKEIKSVEETKQ